MKNLKVLVTILLLAISGSSFASSKNTGLSTSKLNRSIISNLNTIVSKPEIRKVINNSLTTSQVNIKPRENYYYTFGTTCGYIGGIISNYPLSDRLVTNLSVMIESIMCD